MKMTLEKNADYHLKKAGAYKSQYLFNAERNKQKLASREDQNNRSS
jgi:hypothetical protein